MRPEFFFDNAASTRCCPAATEALVRHCREQYGNPSSSHSKGRESARAIREARIYFAKHFQIEPDQVVFTGSGTESDNLAILGVAHAHLAKAISASGANGQPPRVIISDIEHPAVRNTAHSLQELGFDVQRAPVDSEGRIRPESLLDLVSPNTVLVSIQQVNNIIGVIQPVEELAAAVKAKLPEVIFHTDAVQAFGRIPTPRSHSSVDLVSVSAHKIHGPKGVGALFVLNKNLITQNRLRPLIWGGEQERGLRSGTQNAGLIAGFHAAAKEAVENLEVRLAKIGSLQAALKSKLTSLSAIRWNSPEHAVPHIVSLSAPGYPSGPFSRLLEERGCLVSTGSACSSHKEMPDAVLAAMSLPENVTTSALRVSFSHENEPTEIDHLATALAESISVMNQLLGKRSS